MVSATIRAVMSNSESTVRHWPEPPPDDDVDAPSAPPSLQHSRLLATPVPRLQHGRLHDVIATRCTTTTATLRHCYWCRWCRCWCSRCSGRLRFRRRFGGHASHVRIHSGRIRRGSGGCGHGLTTRPRENALGTAAPRAHNPTGTQFRGGNHQTRVNNNDETREERKR